MQMSDLGLHCLPRPICLKTLDHYGIPFELLHDKSSLIGVFTGHKDIIIDFDRQWLIKLSFSYIFCLV